MVSSEAKWRKDSHGVQAGSSTQDFKMYSIDLFLNVEIGIFSSSENKTDHAYAREFFLDVNERNVRYKLVGRIPR